MKRVLIIGYLSVMFLVLGAAEKDRLAVMDVADEAKLFNKTTIANVTDYIFTKLQRTKIYWMVPKADRDTALEQAIEETVKGSRKECVDEKCQLSLVAQLQANFLTNTKIKKLYEDTCNITISKFDVEKREGIQSWIGKFNCTEKGLYETIDGFDFGGIKDRTDVVKQDEASDKNACKYAKEKNNLEIWGKYIEKYPEGECVFEATVRIKELNIKNLSNWSKKSPDEMSWYEAKKYCENLNEDGYSNWRLPTISELRTLIKNCPATETGGVCKVTNECLSRNECRNVACNGCSGASDGRYSKLGDPEWFWSSSSYVNSTSDAWYVSFGNGNVSLNYKANNRYVRCVR